ncbi:MAG: hypothetical protein WA091_00075 [Minisyncoccales bacterium]
MDKMTKQQRLEVLSKEASIIQSIIKRKSTDSFMIKGWTVTLIVATLILQGEKLQVLVAFIPLLSFWFLDAYYQQQMSMYKKLYQWDITNRINTDEYLFDMNAKGRFKDKVPSRPQIMLADKLISFYGSMIILTVAYLACAFYK